MKYNYTYQTKNLINNKTYIGVHSTNNLNDGYIGSGKLLKQAIKKYGKKNFTCTILCFFDTIHEAYQEELFLVDQIWVESTDNYNISLGGNGGYTNNYKKGIDNFHYKKRGKLANKSLPVLVYNLEGEFLKLYDSQLLAAEDLKIDPSCIYQVLSNKRPSSKGYQFKYFTEYYPLKIDKVINARKPNAKKPVNFYTIDRVFIGSFLSLQEAAVTLGLERKSISNAISRNTFKVKNFKFEIV